MRFAARWSAWGESDPGTDGLRIAGSDLCGTGSIIGIGVVSFGLPELLHTLESENRCRLYQQFAKCRCVRCCMSGHALSRRQQSDFCREAATHYSPGLL